MLSCAASPGSRSSPPDWERSYASETHPPPPMLLHPCRYPSRHPNVPGRTCWHHAGHFPGRGGRNSTSALAAPAAPSSAPASTLHWRCLRCPVSPQKPAMPPPCCPQVVVCRPATWLVRARARSRAGGVGAALASSSSSSLSAPRGPSAAAPEHHGRLSRARQASRGTPGWCW